VRCRRCAVRVEILEPLEALIGRASPPGGGIGAGKSEGEPGAVARLAAAVSCPPWARHGAWLEGTQVSGEEARGPGSPSRR
jgi:hypothetical protein